MGCDGKSPSFLLPILWTACWCQNFLLKLVAHRRGKVRPGRGSNYQSSEAFHSLIRVFKKLKVNTWLSNLVKGESKPSNKQIVWSTHFQSLLGLDSVKSWRNRECQLPSREGRKSVDGEKRTATSLTRTRCKNASWGGWSSSSGCLNCSGSFQESPATFMFLTLFSFCLKRAS